MNLYASYGKGFETPTLNDLAYRSTNGSLPGLNIGLQPARSNNYEVGVKAGDGAVRAELGGLLHRDEGRVGGAAEFQRPSGRTKHRRDGAARSRVGGRRGLGGRLHRTAGLHLHSRGRGPGLYDVASARPVSPRRSLPAATCPPFPKARCTPGSPGPTHRLGFTGTLEAQGRARIYADDRNTASAPGYWEANLRAGFDQERPRWRFSEFLRLDNLANRAYVGTVIVNESNSRYFEPAPGRTAYIMFNASWRAD